LIRINDGAIQLAVSNEHSRVQSSGLDLMEDGSVVHDDEAAIRTIMELFTCDKALANLARNSPHRPT
jgi:hypothetical protein